MSCRPPHHGAPSPWHRSLSSALLALAVLALGAIAQPAAAAQEAVTDSAPRFDPSANDGRGGCVGAVSEQETLAPTTRAFDGPRPEGSNIPRTGPVGTWQVSAPRSWPGPTRPGGVADVGLRDKLGTANRMVYADVTRPDGGSDRNGAILVADGWGTLAYPTAFRAAPPLAAGTYTVVWRDTITDRYIACDGFVVEPA